MAETTHRQTPRVRIWSCIRVARGVLGVQEARRTMKASPLFQTLARDAQRRIHEISIDEVHERQDRGEPRFEIVDVRDDDAWRAGHIPGARHLAQGVLDLEIAKAIPDTIGEVVVYGERGLQSLLA